MRKPLLPLVLALVSTLGAGALDIDYAAFVGTGAAMAFGGALTGDLAEFGAAAGAEAYYAPVLGATFGGGIDVGVSGPLRAAAELGLRRLGYAFWAPSIGASAYLALWSAELGLGLRYEPGDWYLGLGARVGTSIGGPRQASSQGGASLDVSYELGAGRTIIPGAYLEGGLSLGFPRGVGPVYVRPSLRLEAGLWPLGLVDDARTWQSALSAILVLELERRRVR